LQSYAQQTRPNSISDALNAVNRSLASPTEAAKIIGANFPNANTGELTQAIESLKTVKGNLEKGEALISGLASGKIDFDLASKLAEDFKLGEIKLPSEITGLIDKYKGEISKITGEIDKIKNIETLLTTMLSPEGIKDLAKDAVKNAVANAIATQFPSLAAAVGGVTQIAGALGDLSNVLQNMSPAQIIQGLINGTIGGILGGALGVGAGAPSTSLTSASTSLPCCAEVAVQIPQHYFDVRNHVRAEFENHRTWFLTEYWKKHILPALMMMANQLTTTGILQIEMFGTLLDAKHQLETQRLFQELTAQAHKDYHPSEGMCTIGTAVTSLAASERISNLSQTTFAQRMMMRQTMNGDSISTESNDSDVRSRLAKFKTTYCAKSDNTNGLSKLCPSAAGGERQNIDIDYTRNIETRLTLNTDFTQNSQTPDKEDVFALSANLYSHNIAERIVPDFLGDGTNKIGEKAAKQLMDIRAVFAKRSVAQNSFAAITALRSSGDDESAPYTKALIRELGITDVAEIEKILGTKPSYFAQMEVLTKKIFQNPTIYTELYDKPVNVERKGAALQAIALMQDRDLYNSLIRSEAVLSVLLETMLEKEQEKLTNAQRGMDTAGGS